MMPYLARKTTSWILAFSVACGAYGVSANTEQVRSAHGGWVTDFHDPRKLVGYADAVFVGRVIAQVGEDESHTPFPQTQFQVAVLEAVKSVKKHDPTSIESDTTHAAVLPDVVTVDQYGARVRDTFGKRTLLLMDEQPLLVPGQTYVLVTAFDAEHQWYHVVPEGIVPITSADTKQAVVDTFKKAKREEIPFTFKHIQGKEGDTPEAPPSTP